MPSEHPSVLVTRPQPQATAWVEALAARGLVAVALPLIDIGPPADVDAVHRAWGEVPGCDLVFFVSPNAVARFFAAAPAGAAWPAGVTAAAPGPGTSDALQACGVPAAATVAPPDDAQSFDAQALWRVLRTQDWRGRRVLIVRGDGGREDFASTLRAAGAEVDTVAAYRRLAPALDGTAAGLLARVARDPTRWVWLFSSSESIANLGALAPALDMAASQALATHPRIAASARLAGFGRVRECRPGVDAVAAAVTGWSIQSGSS